jgi:hypothetical protein
MTPPDPAGRAGEPLARRSGDERPDAVAHERNPDEDRAESRELEGDAAPRVGHELGEHRHEKDDRLGIGDAHDEALGEHSTGVPRAAHQRAVLRHIVAVTDRLDAEEHQVERARDLDGGEERERLLNDHSDPEGDGSGDHEGPGRVARDAQQAADPAEGERPADHEEHARSGDEHEAECGEREREDIAGGDHDVILTARPVAGVPAGVLS